MEETAVSAYGFQSYTPAYPGGLAVQGSTSVSEFSPPHEIFPSLGFGHSNPLFWLLVVLLILTGYISGAFRVSVKKVGAVGAKIG